MTGNHSWKEGEERRALREIPTVLSFKGVDHYLSNGSIIQKNCGKAGGKNPGSGQ